MRSGSIDLRRDPPSVLLVDDVEANLIALEAVLSDLPCTLVRARGGNDALKLLLKRRYAVMLLDVQMPDIDGYEVARLARQHPATREVPIIFLTATHSTEAAVLRGYGTGAVDVLFKPVNGEIVRSKVRVFLELHVTQQKLAAELAAHAETLEELDAFNYSASHDLRAPLRALDGFSEILLSDHAGALDPTAQDYLRRIRRAAQTMAALIDDLLRLSQISREEVNATPVDLASLVRSVDADLREAEPARDVELVAGAAPVRGDARLLRIALDNLLRNAWKFTRLQPKARIELGTIQAPEGPVYFLRDNGVGFDPAHAKKLFRPFGRLHDSSDFEGTGIGLAIVDRIFRHHGGKIWAEGKPGHGATFFFTLGAL